MAREVAYLRSDKGRLVIQFSSKYSRLYYDVKQKYIFIGLEDKPINQKIANRALTRIQEDIEDGKFNPQLVDSYFTWIVDKQTQVTPQAIQGVSLLELWDKYCAYKKTFLYETTYKAQYNGAYRNLISQCSVQDIDKPDEILQCLHSGTKGKQFLIRVVRALNCMIEWARRRDMIPREYKNIFKEYSLQLSQGAKASKQEAAKNFKKFGRDSRVIAFTSQEMELIIEAFKNRYLHPRNSRGEANNIAYLIEFIFRTGVRIGEAIALTWDDIPTDCSTVSINKSYSAVIKRVKPTKTGETRTFPCSSKAKDLLLYIRPAKPQPGEIVFKNYVGGYYCTSLINEYWRGRPDRYSANESPLFKLVETRQVKQYLKPYAMRATFITNQVRAGISYKTIAAWCGNSPEIILNHYESINLDSTPV